MALSDDMSSILHNNTCPRRMDVLVSIHCVDGGMLNDVVWNRKRISPSAIGDDLNSVNPSLIPIL